MNAQHRMPFGAECLGGDGGGVRFALWAPSCRAVELELDGDASGAPRRRPMHARPGGWHELVVPDAGAGTRYRFCVGDGLCVPDPASRFNPQDVHASSEVVDPMSYAWRHADWTGRPWEGAVVYELHVGTFTPQGTFEAAATRLGALQQLGITVVELMPVADFPGARNWGYDGVLPFAPDASYGRPEDLKRFVDAAHELGLMVVLDVVYNHFGPDGNYLFAYCPEFFDAAAPTPWGPALNLTGAQGDIVRSFFVHNALYWIEEYRFDGLRLDAIHAMVDGKDKLLTRDIAAALRAGPGCERAIHLILENDDNTARLLARDARGQPLIATAQWNDDLHHAAHVIATGQRDGYYRDYGGNAVAGFAKALAEGFVYQGQPSAWRGGAARGEPSRALPPSAFIAFLQNHDQVGNRAFGERIDRIAAPRRVDALLCCLLLAPQVPMLFMGEEFAASTPFLYFCDAIGELAQAISQGRRKEFAGFEAFADPARLQDIPDPVAASSFFASKLDWHERDTQTGRSRLELVGQLLRIRHAELVPLLRAYRGSTSRCHEHSLQVTWSFDAADWTLCANFGAAPAKFARDPRARQVFARDAAGLGDAWVVEPEGVLVATTGQASRRSADD